MNAPLQPQAVPPKPYRGGSYRILLISGIVFLLPAVALIVYSITIAASEDAEAAGFAFMGGLCPAVIGVALVIWGLFDWTADRARRQGQPGA